MKYLQSNPKLNEIEAVQTFRYYNSSAGISGFIECHGRSIPRTPDTRLEDDTIRAGTKNPRRIGWYYNYR